MVKTPKLVGALTFPDVAAARRTIRKLFEGKGGSYPALAETIRAFSKRPSEPMTFDGRVFRIAKSTTLNARQLSLFSKGENTPDPLIINAVVCWLVHAHPADLAEILAEEKVKFGEHFVLGARSIVKQKESIPKASQALAFKGAYKFFRPFFLRPESEVMICRANFGVRSDFDLNIEAKYYNYLTASPTEEVLEGKFVPFNRYGFAFLRYSNFTFISLTIDTVTPIGPLVHSMSGILVSLTDAGKSASYRFHAIRDDTDFKVEVRNKNDVYKEVTDIIYQTGA